MSTRPAPKGIGTSRLSHRPLAAWSQLKPAYFFDGHLAAATMVGMRPEHVRHYKQWPKNRERRIELARLDVEFCDTVGRLFEADGQPVPYRLIALRAAAVKALEQEGISP